MFSVAFKCVHHMLLFGPQLLEMPSASFGIRFFILAYRGYDSFVLILSLSDHKLNCLSDEWVPRFFEDRLLNLFIFSMCLRFAKDIRAQSKARAINRPFLQGYNNIYGNAAVRSTPWPSFVLNMRQTIQPAIFFYCASFALKVGGASDRWQAIFVLGLEFSVDMRSERKSNHLHKNT